MDPNALTAARVAETLKTALDEGRVVIHEDGVVDTTHGTLTVTVTVCPTTPPRYRTW